MIISISINRYHIKTRFRVLSWFVIISINKLAVAAFMLFHYFTCIYQRGIIIAYIIVAAILINAHIAQVMNHHWEITINSSWFTWSFESIMSVFSRMNKMFRSVEISFGSVGTWIRGIIFRIAYFNFHFQIFIITDTRICFWLWRRNWLMRHFQRSMIYWSTLWR